MIGSSLLDTTIVVSILRRKVTFEEGIRGYPTFFLNAVVLSELHVGLVETYSPRQEAYLEQILKRTAVLSVTEDTALHHAVAKAALRKAGTPIPENDIWIAASAIEHGLTLITYDRHFEKVGGLRLDLQIKP